MRVLIQRVRRANVSVNGDVIGSIGFGILAFVGVKAGDTLKDAEWLARKTAGLRIFEDTQGKMNHSVLNMGGEALVISQFTLYADCKKGFRPGFSDAETPDAAIPLYERFITCLKEEGVLRVETGCFGANMLVSLENDGPATFLLSHPCESLSSSPEIVKET